MGRRLRDRCSYGHLYTPANTRYYTSPDGYERRICRQCGNRRSRDSVERIWAAAHVRGRW